MEKRYIILSIDEIEDPMSLLYKEKPEWFDGKTPVYLMFDKNLAYYASHEPFTDYDLRKEIIM